ncbi:gamma-glutamyl-gamma-aminobutyrate hydrolase family protein [Pseudonocardia ailaonensis]|uniref:Gamma-glutamyl-gamma-aminobutyrate hydrolase family protein n=2 Tax=Pseudonocardia ailaonensis TaxID=367279 RepID=A0ABN2NBI2_9PSEU
MLGMPPGFNDSPADIYLSEYAQAAIRAGGLPVHLPLDVDARQVAQRIDGLLISGGADIDPAHYGADAAAAPDYGDALRDASELALVQEMRSAGKPVLGICRGAQLINVALGGSLVADLPVGTGESHAARDHPRALRRHNVTFEAGSLAARLYGPSVAVNSFHHQAVDVPGKGVHVSGWADDGVVESIEVEDEDILGVQWHPEALDSDPAFEWLVTSSAVLITT